MALALLDRHVTGKACSHPARCPYSVESLEGHTRSGLPNPTETFHGGAGPPAPAIVRPRQFLLRILFMIHSTRYRMQRAEGELLLPVTCGEQSGTCLWSKERRGNGRPQSKGGKGRVAPNIDTNKVGMGDGLGGTVSR